MVMKAVAYLGTAELNQPRREVIKAFVGNEKKLTKNNILAIRK